MQATLVKIAMSMVTSLLTEAFLKRALVAALEKLVSKTSSDLDDQVLRAAKEAWGLD